MIGRTLRTTSALTAFPPPAAIVGEENPTQFAALTLGVTEFLTTGDLQEGDSGDAGNLAAFTVEFWFLTLNFPASSSDTLIAGPTANPGGTPFRQYSVKLRTDGRIEWTFRDSSDDDDTLTSTSTIQAGFWYHIVCAYGANVQRIYLNGVQDNSAGAGGTPWPSLASGGTGDFRIGDSTSEVELSFDEVAFYRYELPAARVLAHYEAGRERGFTSQLSGARVSAVLDNVNSMAPRRIDAGVRTLIPRYMVGQPPLDELRNARSGDAVDALLFVAKDGAVVYLDADHRSSSPYNTVQATFDDDGTDLPYDDITLDYSESFLANDWNLTRVGNDASTQSASDATSISRYYRRPRNVVGIPVTTDGQVSDIATAMLAKYKDPMTRITSITLTTDTPAVTEAVFRRDIGDRIRVFRTPPGGGSRIDQTLFIQRIEVSGANDGRPWTVRWGVSPV